MNLTIQQEEKAVDVLKQLCQRSKDLLPEISFKLWDNFTLDTKFGQFVWKKLTLSNKGLRLESGLYDRCIDPEGCMRVHKDEIYEPRPLQPEAVVVREYCLTATDLEAILAQLD